MKKNFLATVLWFLYDFLSLKNDVTIPSKRNRHKNLNLREKKIVCWHLEGHWQKEQDPEPDTLVKVRIRGSWSESIQKFHGSGTLRQIMPIWTDPQHWSNYSDSWISIDSSSLQDDIKSINKQNPATQNLATLTWGTDSTYRYCTGETRTEDWPCRWDDRTRFPPPSPPHLSSASPPHHGF